MKNLPKPKQLKIFQSIIEHGGFREAAKILHQTQPTLTKSMNELERILGTQLLIRGPRGVVLTEAGKLFAPRMQLILKELERVVNETNKLSHSSRGTVAMGSSALPFLTLLPSAIRHFQQRFPLVNINLTEGYLSELLPALRVGILDFIIGETVSESATNNEFIVEPLFTAPFAVLARREHPLAQSTSIHQLENAKWYLPSTKVGYYKQINTQLFPEEQQTEQTVIRGDTAMMALQMVLNADFLTVGAREIMQVPFLSNQLCALPIKEPLPDASFSFIYSRHSPLTPIASRMMEKLRRESKNYPWFHGSYPVIVPTQSL